MIERFIKNPNLPEGRVSLAIADGRISVETEKMLLERGVRLIKTDGVSALYSAVAFHPDIMMFYAGEGRAVVPPDAPDKLYYSLEKEGLHVKIGNKTIGNSYPDNVGYNTALIGDYALCNEKHTDEGVLKAIESSGKSIINIKQGYAKCSICVVDRNCIITSDNGIIKNIEKYFKDEKSPIEMLKVSDNDIVLNSMDKGFIGGATGKLSKEELGFYGEMELLGASVDIERFLTRKNIKRVNMCSGRVMDYGTLIAIKEYVEEDCI